MGDQEALVNERQAVPPPQPPPVEVNRPTLRGASDFLQDNDRIGSFRSRFDKYRRYAHLNSQNIFNSLVTLYTSMFRLKWNHFRRFMDQFGAGQIDASITYAARAYISAWFHDLYVSNREAVLKLTPLAYAQHYEHQSVYISTEYDIFLTTLNASIRPTNLKGIPEDVLYIPIISETVDWANAESNIFNINNFVLNYDCAVGLISIMKERRDWNMSSLVTNVTGRPCWLFDWHNDNTNCCSFFPMEENFNMDDVMLAYIVGVACTPRLGPRDVSDWIPFPHGVAPAAPNVSILSQTVIRKFYGAYEIAELELRTLYGAQPTPVLGGKRARTEASASGSGSSAARSGAAALAATDEPATTDGQDTAMAMTAPQREDQYRITFWIYYRSLVLNIEQHTRLGALKMLIHSV